ncbi:hypothetical protein IKG02_01200 [Candidatus Saccharibacteria bacterium]|nr:hypothetical protein [Candidatus Saccharibacteria bacterium]
MRIIPKTSARSGFTLVELSFAIAFVSVLVITVTLISNEIINLYRKGYSIKTVNQIGRDLMSDFTGSIQNSPPASFRSFCNRYNNATNKANCEANNANYSLYQQFYSDIFIGDVSGNISDEKKTVPTGGAFCTGNYSYVWNTGYVLGDSYYVDDSGTLAKDSDLSLWLKIGDRAPIKDFRLLKIQDPSRSVCAYAVSGGYPDTNAADGSGVLRAPNLAAADTGIGRTHPGIKLDAAPSEEPVELLSESDSPLVLYDFVIFPPARISTTSKLFMSGSFILGTKDGGIDIMTTSNYCQTPNSFNADFSYCAINKFNFGTQASGV